MNKHFLFFPLILAMAGCSQGEPPFQVDTYDRVNPVFGVEYVEVKVTGKSEEVEIQDIAVNRGNCELERIREQMGAGKTLPRTLEFGESAEFSFSAPCKASEVEVVTDQGDWTWEY